MVNHHLALRDRIHDGSFYTILNDGMKSGKKRRANEPPPNETALFNPFTDNATYTSKYHKVRRRIPNLDSRPYGKLPLLVILTDTDSSTVTDLFPPELRSLLGDSTNKEAPSKKRKTLQVATSATVTSRIDNYLVLQGQRPDGEERGDDADEDYDEEDEEDEEEKPDAVGEEDNWSAVSSDSEESGDDYNAERYFDGGDDDDMDDGDPYENSYE